nr:MAG TPA: hypothetical protein [Caudoviricetes sp.]
MHNPLFSCYSSYSNIYVPATIFVFHFFLRLYTGIA